MADHDPIRDINFKMDREKALINGAVTMLRQSENPVVKSSLETQIKEARKNMAYLQQKRDELLQRANEQNMGNMNLGVDSRQGGRSPYGAPSPSADYGAPPGGEGYSDQLNAGSGTMPSRPPFDTGPGSTMPRARPNYSKLGKLWTTLSRHRTNDARLDQSRHAIPWPEIPVDAFTTYI